MAYYSPGDEVVYTPKGCGAKIIQGYPNDEYIVEFEDKNLIPPQMKVPGHTLRPKPVPTLFGGFQPSDFLGLPTYNNKETHCPRCQTPWTVSQGMHEPWYDCLKCNLKREDS